MAALEDILESLQNFDTDQLNDFNKVGSWPLAVKAILWIMVFVAALSAGYFFHITNLQQQLQQVEAKELTLRKDYEEKAMEAALLDDYRRQQKEMEERFDNILRQLPSDTEIPGLIEDINNVGLKNGLTFDSIKLQPEKKHEFYIEKPINIVVSGSYHELGAFVSDVADLSRIVTLQDFSIRPVSRRAGDVNEGEKLRMTITAKTYRYNDQRA
jgi:type IV pilus assembly protein PilO